jgi:hypothetical protein
MKSHSKKAILAILIAIILILLGIQKISPKVKRYLIEKENREIVESIKEETAEKEKTIEAPTETIAESQKILPEKAYLEVQFICQAPLETEENWTYHEESCEEAALLQAYLYETGQTMTKQEANEEILKMIDWQNKNYGSQNDLYAEELKEFAINYYEDISDSDIKIIENARIEDIKKEVANGHPAIVPITGEILKNPYYPYPGYHMLIVTGYTEDKIITNDNGTRRGKDYSYDIDIFTSAMEDAGGDILILNKN